MRHRNIIGPQVRRLRNQRGWSQNDLAIKLQCAGMEDATRRNVSKLEARLIRAIDEDMLYLARVLRVELLELYPESVRCPLDLYEAIRRLQASRYGIFLFTALLSCSQMGAGTFDLVIRLGA
jgi:transcriptional regulator with XRE-family HTH domain